MGMSTLVAKPVQSTQEVPETAELQKEGIKGTRVVWLDRALASKIVVKRFDGKVGFQRLLDGRKVAGVIQSAEVGEAVPPILVADVDGTYLLVDGQHRLEAWRKRQYPLVAQITKMSATQAAADFVAINAKASRVSLRHRLLVDPGPFAKRLRKMSEKYACDITQANSLLLGLTGRKSRHYLVQGMEWSLADTILDIWSQDSRWKPLKRNRTSVYSSPALLMAIGFLVKDKPHDVKSIVKKLKKLGYDKKGAVGRKCRTTHAGQQDMKNFFLKKLFVL